MFDDFGCAQAGHQNGAAERAIEFVENAARPLRIDSAYDPLGLGDVVESYAFLQELGIGSDVKIDGVRALIAVTSKSADGAIDPLRCDSGNRTLLDDELVAIQIMRDGSRGVLNL